MSETTPAPGSTPTPAPAGPQIMTVEQVIELERMFRENKQAQLRGEPLPHTVTPEMLRDAINAIRTQRGTLPLQSEKKGGSGKKGGGKATAIEINLDL